MLSPWALSGLSLLIVALIAMAIQLARRSSDTGTVVISALDPAATGVVQVTGSVSGGYEQLSPIFKRRCVWWRCVVEAGKNNSIRVSETLSSPYLYLKDGDTEAAIDTRGATFYLDEESTTMAQNRVMELISAAKGNKQFSVSSWTIVQVREEIVPPFSPLFVKGEVLRRQGLPGDRRDRWQETLDAGKAAFTKENGDTLSASNLQAWDRFRADLESTFDRRERQTAGQEQLVIRSPASGRFIVSLQSLKEVLKHSRDSRIAACGLTALIGAFITLETFSTHLPKQLLQCTELLLLLLLIPAAYFLRKDAPQR